jgi:hemerythrin
MDFIEWGYEYSLGVPEIDSQHKKLVDQLNDTIKHCTGKKTDERLFFDNNMKKTIDFLEYHFETEEKILCKTGYENFNKHKTEHKKILEELIKMNDDIEKNKVELDLFYVTAYIKERVTKHIKIYDLSARKYFVEGNEIK